MKLECNNQSSKKAKKVKEELKKLDAIVRNRKKLEQKVCKARADMASADLHLENIKEEEREATIEAQKLLIQKALDSGLNMRQISARLGYANQSAVSMLKSGSNVMPLSRLDTLRLLVK